MALEADYVKMIEDRSIMSVEYRLPLLTKTDPPCLQRGFSAITELLVL